MLYAPFADQEIEIVQAADVGLFDPLWIVLPALTGTTMPTVAASAPAAASMM